MNTIYKIFIALWGVAMLVGLGLLIDQRDTPVSGIGDTPYYSTTTKSTGLPYFLLKTGRGEFGSVIMPIPTSLVGGLTVYDATTTNTKLRNNTGTTTLIQLAAFPLGYSTSTYTYDFNTVFTNGLLFVYDAANAVGSTTITWR